MNRNKQQSRKVLKFICNGFSNVNRFRYQEYFTFVLDKHQIINGSYSFFTMFLFFFSLPSLLTKKSSQHIENLPEWKNHNT